MPLTVVYGHILQNSLGRSRLSLLDVRNSNSNTNFHFPRWRVRADLRRGELENEEGGARGAWIERTLQSVR